MSTYHPSRPRRRLLSFLLLMTLLVSLVMPALAQEGAPPAVPVIAEQSAAQIAATDKNEMSAASPEMVRSNVSPNGRRIAALHGTT